MFLKIFLFINLLFLINPTFAQTGATGTNGSDMAGLGYINYSAAFGGDQLIASPGNVTIGSSGNVDIYGALQIDNGATLTLLSGAVLNIYGNLRNNGLLAISSGATINYYGLTWTNGTSSQVTNNDIVTGSPGNAVNFITPQPTVPSSWLVATANLSAYSGATQMQNLEGGDIPMHVVLHVKNSSNINLNKSNTSLSGQLSFDVASGHVIVNSLQFTFTETGTHTGAAADRYIQTNLPAGLVNKLGLSNGNSFLLPIGYMLPTDYTPININITSGSTDNYHVNVTDFAASPPDESNVYPNVQRTWLVYSDASAASATLNFVHYLSLETPTYSHLLSTVFQLNNGGNWRPKPYCGSEISGAYGLAPDYYAQKIESVELPTCALCSNSLNGTYFTKSLCQDIILAATLGKFSASVMADKCDVLISWETLNEEGLKTFVIERSANANEWSTLAKMSPAGNAVTGNSYKYVDNSLSYHHAYYRLKMIDANGNSSYSNIVEVKSDCRSVPLTIYPNPSHSTAMVLYNTDMAHTSVRVYNSQGKIVPVTATQIDRGWLLNMGILPGGIYMIALIQNGKHVVSGKLIKY